MKKSNDPLDRLLRAAGQFAPATAEEEPPFGFVTRVVAGWKPGTAREGFGLEALWFRRAFLCALAVMAVAVGWSYKIDTTAPNEEMAIASYDASADLP